MWNRSRSTQSSPESDLSRRDELRRRPEVQASDGGAYAREEGLARIFLVVAVARIPFAKQRRGLHALIFGMSNQISNRILHGEITDQRGVGRDLRVREWPTFHFTNV